MNRIKYIYWAQQRGGAANRKWSLKAHSPIILILTLLIRPLFCFSTFVLFSLFFSFSMAVSWYFSWLSHDFPHDFLHDLLMIHS